jgi:hypothetical protein
MGNLIATNAETVPGSPIWRGIVAYPIVMSGSVSTAAVDRVVADRLTIGAITLNSNRTIAALDPNKNGVVGNGCSIMSVLDASYVDELAASLQWVATEVLSR